MANIFYRFRSINSLLEYKELENQIIYFAPPEDLNDPMEGYIDIVWSGDEIVWKNFFRHYLLCLERVVSLLVIGGEKYTISEKNIPVFDNIEHFPTSEYKELFEKISSEFIDCLLPLIKKIAIRSTAIRRDELYFYLDIVHFIALDVIEKNYIKNKFIPVSKSPKIIRKAGLKYIIDFIDSLEKEIQSNNNFSEKDIFLMQKSIRENLKLHQNLEHRLIIDNPNRNFVFIDFIDKYLLSIERLIYPKWHTACFMKECHNSSVWGHYGDNHKGVCLIFKSDNMSINLSSAENGRSTYKFEKINYQHKFPEIDFFKSIGRLTAHRLKKDWYTDENGNSSYVAKSVLGNVEIWRKKYWTTYNKIFLTKTKDWEYEKEYRLILSSTLSDYETKEERLLNYDFKSLKGLIFGIKTTMKDKIKIIDILKKKLKEEKRDDFELYQAYFSSEKQNIQYSKISLW